MTDTPKATPTAQIIEAMLPPDMALACEAAGAAKARRDALALIVLGVLAGAFIALGAIFMTVVLTGAEDLPWGVARLLAGLVFSLGLILVIVGGAELFTGDSLMIVACASRRITLGALLRAWSLVYVGNIAGALGTAALVFLAGQHGFGGGAVGKTALAVASAKAALPTVQLFFLAVLCNVLVCLAVWMSFGARSTTDKVLVIVPPIAAFVAAGFEHSIANMYFLPLATMLQASLGQAPEFAWLWRNLVPVIAGNIAGGSVLVALVYYVIYRRGTPAS
jgi:formate/nitrite transporter